MYENLGNKLFRKKRISTVALILLLAASAFVTFLPIVNAQTQQNYPSYIFVAANPDPIGINEPIVILTWTAEIPPTTPFDNLLGSVGNRQAWTGITIDITKPNGNKQTIPLAVTDPIGGSYARFTPDQIGTYSIVAHFPSQWKNTTTYKRLYAAADSPVDTFTVTNQPLQWLSGVQLPTEYWTRPINAYNREWSQIGGNWLADGQGNPYTSAPDTAHVVWTKPIQLGGLTGEPFGQLSYYEGTSYEQRWSYPIIISGMLIYSQPLGHKDVQSRDVGSFPGQELIAVNLRTGQEIWRREGVAVTKATIYNYESPNQHGTHAYLWTSGTNPTTAIDPFTGADAFNITNLPSGAEAVGPSGERIIYVIGGSTSNRNSLALWNSTAMLTMTLLSDANIAAAKNDSSILSTTNAWQWRPISRNQSHDGLLGYSWNVSLTKPVSGNILFAFDNMVFGGTGFGSSGQSVYSDNYQVWAIRTEPGNKGQVMWNIAPKPPKANVTIQFEGTMVNEEAIKAGVIIMRAKETMQWMGFDLNTGAKLWTTEPENNWMMYSRGIDIKDGKFYSAGYGGEVYAYDIKTGKLLWKSQIDNEGLESVYERAPLSSPVVVDGKVFVYTQEHSMTQPYYRTWKQYVFDAQNGSRVWDITGAYRPQIFADGYMATLNMFEMQIYTFGKGPTQTTVTAPNIGVALGNSVLLQGKVVDTSAGTKQDGPATRFPEGIPAVADANMTDWMEYVYMQMPKPTNVKGVPVQLTAIDPNGNYQNIGTVTSDAMGNYAVFWQPPVPGLYKVTAEFKGSESYWPSTAETNFGVTTAPSGTVVSPQPTSTQPAQPTATAPSQTASPSSTTAPPPTSESPITTTYVAIGAAVIVIVAAAAALILRRRK